MPADDTSPRREKFDYVVVGAGSAGCVVAARLSEDPACRVLLLEAGGEDDYLWIHVPVGYFKTMHNPRTDWRYKTEPQSELGGRQLDWPRGKVLGGSSSINGLLYVRGQPRDYDHWRQLGNAGWSWDDVLPYFLRSEDQERGESTWHGVGGPLAVSNMRIRRDVCDAFIRGAAELGLPTREDFNGEEQEGAGYFQLTARDGRRCSTAVGYLRPARKRRNLVVRTHAHTERLLLVDGRVIGVRYQGRDGAAVEVEATREVVLSAGAIGSPQILQISGIGPPDVLGRAGVRCQHALPGVGRNLQDHLQVRSVYRCTRPTLNDEVNNPLRKALIGLEYIVRRTGPMSMGASQVAAFARTRPELETPDIQFHFQPLSADKPGEGLHRFSAFTVSVCQLRPESRGHIDIRSPDPHQHPAIEPRYLTAPTDRATVVAGMRLTRRLCATDAMRPFVAEEILPGSDVEGDDALLDAARRLSQTIYHPVGTCRMGEDPMAVVDARLRLRGLGGLRVVDASIMPTITSGNTNAPVIMIAEKAAELIRADARAGHAA
ncbi:MAG: choline dehydrogenase [Ectothiorhodospiraceae bacterium]|nr:choline dehydrogenase [Chromatiales bacterium]MCP5155494.1 choline dehydrogenase [Ectothiorhodospiraceae bacterium]